MKQITTPIKLFKNNFRKEFSETKYPKDASEVNVGFIGEQQLRNLNVHKKVFDLALLNIKRETKGFYIAIVKKLLEKSPLNYKLVRNAEWLNSLKLKEDRNVSVDQLTKCLEVLCNTGRIKADKCDEVISEFKSFMDEKKEVIAEFEYETRLDHFYHFHLATSQTYKNLWRVIKIVLLLSHGQASVERGF